MEVKTLEQIKADFPNESVLLGNPEISGTKVIAGIVFLHSKNKREIAYSPLNWRIHFQKAITIFAGELPKNRKYWL